ncbi:MAG TPA: efflux RND transporter permease subunit [Vicinamibacterales bacterium]|jgi:cobalt-zinc-cadmium resistance protein CzcA
MTSRLMNAAFGRPAFTILVVLIAAAFGVVSFQQLRRDVFPDLSAPVFNVIVQNPAMGAEELEVAVAIPLETALAGLPEVRRIRSSSQLGVSQITIEFEPDADYYRARQFVAERIGQASSDLPPGTGAPLLSSLTGRLNEVLEFTIEAQSGAVDLMTLRDLAEFEIKNRLLGVPGVAAVERLGGYLRQFQIQIDPSRMSARNVTLDEVMHAVDDANINASGGFVTQGGTEWAVRAVGRVRTIDDLRTTVVAVKDRVPVMLGDISDVLEAPAVRRGMAHRLAGEVVSCRVVKQFGADTVTVAAAVRAAITDINRTLPKGVTLRMVYDQSELVGTALGGVSRAILIGAGLVVLILFILLGNWRAALLVTLTLPLTIALAGLLLRLVGVGINTMTLGGLAIAVGLLVDAAIIVTENVVHHLQREPEAPRRDVALRAAQEVGRPILFATLIVVAVFVPLFAMTGIEGRMYRPLAAAVVAALTASLLLALTIVPVAASLLLRAPRPDVPEDVYLVRMLKRAYAPLLDLAMRRPSIVRIATLLITVPTIALAFVIGSDFMPQLDEGAFLLQTMLPPDSSLEEVDRVNHRVEDVLRRFRDVSDVVRRTGRAEQTEDPMPHVTSDVLVVLKPDRSTPLPALESEMREALENVPGASVLFTTPLGMRIDEGLGGTPADLSVRIFGPDLDELAKLGAEAQRVMSSVKGIEDLRVEAVAGLPQLRVSIDRQAVARTGLTPGDVIRALRIGLVGEEASQVWVGQRRYDLVVRLSDSARGSAAAIRTLRLEAHDGTRIPIEQIARVEEVFAPGAIRREAGSRRVAIEASVSGRDLGSAAAEIRQRLATDLHLPTGYFWNVGGRVEQQERATQSLTVAIAAAILAVFVLLYLALGSFAETAVILATIPSAFVGGIAALMLAGETWNVSSLVGLIGLFGIAVQNSLVLIAQTRTLMREGRPFREALHEASIGRVRPKVMTASTAILGLLPLLVLNMHGTEIERPLAVVMIGGVVTSTAFTLVALPTFYLFVQNLGAKRLESR